jgi:adenylate cyclase
VESAQRAVLFVDITDSTRLYESLGDTAALALINALFEPLGASLAKFSGTIVKTLGDGMLCEFPDADSAFRAACDAQTAVTALLKSGQSRLKVKVAFTWGPVILSKGDVFGDTMNVCSRLVTLANPEQILTSGQTVEALSPELRTRCRALFATRLKGKADEIPVFDVQWRHDPGVTETNLTRADLARPARAVLKLIYRGNIFLVGRDTPALQLGRDDGNEVVVASLFASRVHARVHAREGHFVLSDVSTNGTFMLSDDHSHEVHLRREEAVLGDRGYIGLGKSAVHHGDHTVRFAIEHESA